MATLNGQKVQVLVWNYHDDLVTVAATSVRLTVKVPASFGTRLAVSNLRVDDTHGDAYTVWTSQGSPASPSATQIAALKAAMDPQQLTVDQTVDATGGSAVVTFDLPRFGISLVTLAPTTVPGDAGADAASDGGRDAAVDMSGADRPADVGTGAGGAGGAAGAGGGGGAGSGRGGAAGGGAGSAGTAGASGTGGGAGTAASGGAGGSGTAGASGAGNGGSAGSAGTAGATGSGVGGGSGSKAGGCSCAMDPGTAPAPLVLVAFVALAIGAVRSRRRPG
jgi:MYXO-CTERM domain-containing protein